MENLYSAKIEKFKTVEKNDLRIRFEIDVDSIYHVLGIQEGNFIYDLLTGRSYPILNKLNNGLIDPSSDIITDKEYATNIEPFYEKNIRESVIKLSKSKIPITRKTIYLLLQRGRNLWTPA